MKGQIKRANDDVIYTPVTAEPAPEKRSEQILVKVTPTEKRQFEALCRLKKTTLSTRGAELIAADVKKNSTEIAKYLEMMNDF